MFLFSVSVFFLVFCSNMLGDRFRPTPEELVSQFLNKKRRDPAFTDPRIGEVDVYKHHPRELPGLSPIQSDEQVWYFFCTLNYKYAKSERANRKAFGGSWKITALDRDVMAKHSNKPIGFKKTLTFYQGCNFRKENKTNWIMHEYHEYRRDEDPHSKDKLVVCHIELKPDKKRKPSSSLDEGQSSDSLAYDSPNNAAQDIPKVECHPPQNLHLPSSSNNDVANNNLMKVEPHATKNISLGRDLSCYQNNIYLSSSGEDHVSKYNFPEKTMATCSVNTPDNQNIVKMPEFVNQLDFDNQIGAQETWVQMPGLESQMGFENPIGAQVAGAQMPGLISQMGFENQIGVQMTGAQMPVVHPTISVSVPVPMDHLEKPEKFSGTNFKRWQQKMLFSLTTLSLAKFLTEDRPKLDDDELTVQAHAWDHFDFLCRNYVMNGLADSLYNVYASKKTAKELWESLDRKYKTEDMRAKKLVVSRLLDYKMVDSKPVISQVQEIQVILHEIHSEGMILGETFQVACIIEKLPSGWKDFKNYLKHKRKEMNIEELIVKLRIEEDNRSSEKKNVFSSDAKDQLVVCGIELKPYKKHRPSSSLDEGQSSDILYSGKCQLPPNHSLYSNIEGLDRKNTTPEPEAEVEPVVPAMGLDHNSISTQQTQIHLQQQQVSAHSCGFSGDSNVSNSPPGSEQENDWINNSEWPVQFQDDPIEAFLNGGFSLMASGENDLNSLFEPPSYPAVDDNIVPV